MHAGSLPAEPQGKPKNSGVGNLSLLQGIFATQESNRGLLHCRWIFYQLSYQGSPEVHQAQPQIRASLGEKCVIGRFIKKFLIESQSILLQFLLDPFQILPNSFDFSDLINNGWNGAGKIVPGSQLRTEGSTGREVLPFWGCGSQQCLG